MSIKVYWVFKLKVYTLCWRQSMKMNECNTVEKKKVTSIFVFLLFCCLIASIFILFYLVSPYRGQLADSDCYIHLLRARELYQNGNWYHVSPIKSNTPFGEISHWSRPFDVLLLVGTLPGMLVNDFETALWRWGIILSPALMAVTLIVLNWTVRPIFGKEGSFLVIMFFLLQIVIVARFQAGRPDHHSLLVVLFVAQIGLGMRLVRTPFQFALCYFAGAVSAFSIWVLIESIVPVGLTIVVLGVFWIWHKADFLKISLHYCISVAVFTFVCLSLERLGKALLIPEYDRISIVYCCALGLIMLFWVVIAIVDKRSLIFNSLGIRLLGGVLGSIAILISMWILYPNVYRGPLADVDPAIFPIWFNKINEMQPLLTNWVIAFQIVGQSLICFLWLGYIIKKEACCRNIWIYMAICLVFFLLLSLNQIRWAVYTQTLLCIIIADFACRLLQKFDTKCSNALLRSLQKGFAVLALSLGFSLIGLAAEEFIKTGEQSEMKAVPLAGLCTYLNVQTAAENRTLGILTDPDFAGELLYRTQHEVLASNYHRNAAGVLDAYKIMTADTDLEAVKLLRARRIDLIILCPEGAESRFYSKHENTSTFYQRLREGSLPSWMEKISLPDDLSSSFTMYKIRYDD